MQNFKCYADSRNKGFCVHCGGPYETDDHVPSKVLLDEPSPENLLACPSCMKCNNDLSATKPIWRASSNASLRAKRRRHNCVGQRLAKSLSATNRSEGVSRGRDRTVMTGKSGVLKTTGLRRFC